MLELARTDVAVVACLASPEALDALPIRAAATALRTAPDELLLLAAPAEAMAVREQTAGALAPLEEDALVLEVTDGWTAWTLGGADAREAFARLSMLELPPTGLVQGDVARVPTKIVAAIDRVHLLVPSSWGEYLRERILGLALEVREAGEPRAWEVTGP